MNQPPLNPDALNLRAYDEALLAFKKVSDLYPVQAVALKDACIAYAAHLAAALPEVTSVEELDQLPHGVIVLDGDDDAMLLSPDGEGGADWVRFYDRELYRAKDVILPARVLYRPEVKP